MIYWKKRREGKKRRKRIGREREREIEVIMLYIRCLPCDLLEEKKGRKKEEEKNWKRERERDRSDNAVH